MKVSDLKGTELALWVAKAEGFEILANASGKRLATHNNELIGYIDGEWAPRYRPDCLWEQGGEIIDKQDIFMEISNFAENGKIFAFIYKKNGIDVRAQQWGDTRLEAAMRAYVSKVYGDEVPDITA